VSILLLGQIGRRLVGRVGSRRLLMATFAILTRPRSIKAVPKAVSP